MKEEPENMPRLRRANKRAQIDTETIALQEGFVCDSAPKSKDYKAREIARQRGCSLIPLESILSSARGSSCSPNLSPALEISWRGVEQETL